MDLAFTTFEVASVALAVWIGAAIVVDAESNWLEVSLLPKQRSAGAARPETDKVKQRRE